MSVAFMILFSPVMEGGGVLFVSLHHYYADLIIKFYEFYVCRRTRSLAVMARLADSSQGFC